MTIDGWTLDGADCRVVAVVVLVLVVDGCRVAVMLDASCTCCSYLVDYRPRSKKGIDVVVGIVPVAFRTASPFRDRFEYRLWV